MTDVLCQICPSYAALYCCIGNCDGYWQYNTCSKSVSSATKTLKNLSCRRTRKPSLEVASTMLAQRTRQTTHYSNSSWKRAYLHGILITVCIFPFPHCAVTVFPNVTFTFQSIGCIRSRKGTIFILWSWTLSYDLDLWKWSWWDQVETLAKYLGQRSIR